MDRFTSLKVLYIFLALNAVFFHGEGFLNGFTCSIRPQENPTLYFIGEKATKRIQKLERMAYFRSPVFVASHPTSTGPMDMFNFSLNHPTDAFREDGLSDTLQMTTQETNGSSVKSLEYIVSEEDPYFIAARRIEFENTRGMLGIAIKENNHKYIRDLLSKLRNKERGSSSTINFMLPIYSREPRSQSEHSFHPISERWHFIQRVLSERLFLQSRLQQLQENREDNREENVSWTSYDELTNRIHSLLKAEEKITGYRIFNRQFDYLTRKGGDSNDEFGRPVSKLNSGENSHNLDDQDVPIKPLEFGNQDLPDSEALDCVTFIRAEREALELEICMLRDTGQLSDAVYEACTRRINELLKAETLYSGRNNQDESDR